MKNLVEVAKEEPKVLDAIVDHLTHQDALATVHAETVESTPEAQEAAAAHHQRVASVVDPVALENIAYAVDCNTDDAALDELISLLNHDDTIAEEDIQEMLDMAAAEVSDEVPPTVTINMAPISASSSSEAAPGAPPCDSVMNDSMIRPLSAAATQAVAANEDLWRTDPLMNFDWR